ncbi:hypothetical protein GUJ93_ZPchr0002g23452 [Zizania palustris]|uniref:Nucleotide-diphospho-sugar transferase domain-containing protein n=1 Tax=Zizania palustris TaxID=103762 RepID=A0A8J5VGW4_ZIZPA|nr:hypothetical protein GUJ93_ZPchr0002g23452 [Zizania palustris]
MTMAPIWGRSHAACEGRVRQEHDRHVRIFPERCRRVWARLGCAAAHCATRSSFALLGNSTSKSRLPPSEALPLLLPWRKASSYAAATRAATVAASSSALATASSAAANLAFRASAATRSHSSVATTSSSCLRRALEESDNLKLEQVLQEASMDNKTIILTTMNAAWASPGSVIDLFIDSFRRGVRTSSLLRHLVIITFDWKAYKQCKKIHTHCFALVTKDVDFSQEKRFQTSGYLEMMWKRLDFLRLVLEKGYSFIFSDADIMWFRNPFPHFYPDGDFQIACDHYVGNASDLRNIANGGFNYVRSNNHSIEFYKFCLKRFGAFSWRVPQNCSLSLHNQ